MNWGGVYDDCSFGGGKGGSRFGPSGRGWDRSGGRVRTATSLLIPSGRGSTASRTGAWAGAFGAGDGLGFDATEQAAEGSPLRQRSGPLRRISRQQQARPGAQPQLCGAGFEAVARSSVGAARSRKRSPPTARTIARSARPAGARRWSRRPIRDGGRREGGSLCRGRRGSRTRRLRWSRRSSFPGRDRGRDGAGRAGRRRRRSRLSSG